MPHLDKRRKRKSLQCANAVPNGIENEPNLPSVSSLTSVFQRLLRPFAFCTLPFAFSPFRYNPPLP